MPKNGNSVALLGKSHSIPRGLVNLVSNLELMPEVENVGIGIWYGNGKSVKEMKKEVKYYNETTRTLKLVIYFEDYKSDLFVRVKPDLRETVEEFIKNYH